MAQATGPAIGEGAGCFAVARTPHWCRWQYQ